MKYELYKENNTKKLVIGISIIFCIIILILGTSYAFFGGSSSNKIDELVTENINNTLKYTDNSDYMKGNLIPVIEDDVSSFVMNNSELDNICKYTDEYNACSLYEFTIENTASVAQKLNATLTPTRKFKY